MRCSLSPSARASGVCILMKLELPLSIRAEALRDAFPAIDYVDHHGQVHLFLRGEMRIECLACLLLCVPLRKAGQGIGPAERGTFPRREDRRFVPCGEQIDALFTLALRAGFGGVHIDAVGTAI